MNFGRFTASRRSIPAQKPEIHLCPDNLPRKTPRITAAQKSTIIHINSNITFLLSPLLTLLLYTIKVEKSRINLPSMQGTAKKDAVQRINREILLKIIEVLSINLLYGTTFGFFRKLLI